jgi:hypothetical protein
MNYLIRTTVIVLFIISAFSFFSKPPKEDHSKNLGHPWEEYDSAYFNKFQSIQSVIGYSDSCMGSNNKDKLAYYNLVAEIIRKRFYHGYSYYGFSDNPLSYMAARCIWNDLSAIVIPDDIMKHPMAACSQQAIVLAEIFRRNKINYRKVAFKSHFAIEGFIEKKWRFFDPDMEPKLLPGRESAITLMAENKLTMAYANSGFNMDYLGHILRKPKAGQVNELPALRASVFHRICLLMISKWFLFAVFALSFMGNIRLKVLNKMFAWRINKFQISDNTHNVYN